MLVLDSGGLSRLASRTRRTAALIEALRRHGLWPPTVPTVVIAESTTGKPRSDTNINRLLKACDIDPVVSERTARRAGALRAAARRGSAVAALAVAVAGPGSTVLTTDPDDLQALAAHADNVTIETVDAEGPRSGRRTAPPSHRVQPDLEACEPRLHHSAVG